MANARSNVIRMRSAAATVIGLQYGDITNVTFIRFQRFSVDDPAIARHG
jgi:hypothetical protein